VQRHAVECLDGRGTAPVYLRHPGEPYARRGRGDYLSHEPTVCSPAAVSAEFSGPRSNSPVRVTGLSSPSEVACVASAVSEDWSGSSVNVISLNEAATMLGLSGLPVYEASSVLTSACAAAAFFAMKSLAWTCAFSRSATTAGCAARKDCVTTSSVVTPVSLSSTVPPSLTICTSYGAGSEPPAICPD